MAEVAEVGEANTASKRALEFVDAITTSPTKKKQKQVALQNVDVDELVKFLKQHAKRVQQGEESPDLLQEILAAFRPQGKSFRSYCGLTFSSVCKEMKLLYQYIVSVAYRPVSLSPHLLAICARIDSRVNMKLEVACRMLIDAVLLEALESAPKDLCLFPEHPIQANVSVESGNLLLFGEPDYILSKAEMPPGFKNSAQQITEWVEGSLQEGSATPARPFCVVVEAKRSADFLRGAGQLIAEMVAAAKSGGVLNINGILTSGNMWQFFRMEGPDLVSTLKMQRETSLETIVGVLINLFNGGTLTQLSG